MARKIENGYRNKTVEELADETKADLVLCDALGCGSHAKFYTQDKLFLCVTHLCQKYGIEWKTDKPAKLVVRS